MELAVSSAKEEAGVVVGVNVSAKRGVKKRGVASATLVPAHGIRGDAHAGDWHRQVSLLADESIAKMRSLGVDVSSGDFAENITTRGIDLPSLQIGDHVMLGEVLLEVTQVGKVCHARCEIYRQVGDCVMPAEGVFARVLLGGEIRAGVEVRTLRARKRRKPSHMTDRSDGDDAPRSTRAMAAACPAPYSTTSRIPNATSPPPLGVKGEPRDLR